MNKAKWHHKLLVTEFTDDGPLHKTVEPRCVNVLAVVGEWAMVSYVDPMWNLHLGVVAPPFVVPSADLEFMTPNGTKLTGAPQ